MKNHPMLHAVGALVIGVTGLTATVNASLAADIGMPQLTDSADAMSASAPQVQVYLAEKSRKASGAQGPIRTDFSDQTNKPDAETLRSDGVAYPPNEGVPMP